MIRATIKLRCYKKPLRDKPERPRKQGAFTLVELVVALALGAMLMTALVGILRSVSGQLKLAQTWATREWETSAVELLHRDLMLSARISHKDGWIWLDGEFPDFQRPEGREQRVGYSCVPWMNETSAMIRLGAGSADLVAVGPRRILLERLDQTNTPQPLSEAATVTPERLRLWIWSNDSSEPSLVRDIALR